MVRILTKLRVDEISSVDRGAGEGVKIVLMKRDDDMSPQRRRLTQIFAKAFKARNPYTGYLRKAAVSDPLRGPRDEDDDSKLSGKLKAMVDAMIVAVPSLDRQTAQHFLLHHPRGRHLALHLNAISKTEKDKLPMLDVSKLIPVLEEGLLAQAKLTRRDKQTEAQAFAELYAADIDFRKQWVNLTEMKHQLSFAKSFPGMMSLEPTQVGGKDATNVNDPAAALRQLDELVAEQRRRAPTLTAGEAFELVFTDPENAALAAATYSRPIASSTSGDELQRR